MSPQEKSSFRLSCSLTPQLAHLFAMLNHLYDSGQIRLLRSSVSQEGCSSSVGVLKKRERETVLLLSLTSGQTVSWLKGALFAATGSELLVPADAKLVLQLMFN